MRDVRRLLFVVPATALLVCLVLLFTERGTMEQLSFLRHNQGATGNTLVDQQPYQTARTLAELAVSAEEQSYAQDALRIADHEVDQAFAMALRQAEVRQHTLTGEALALSQHITELKALVKDDQARVETLTAALKASGNTSAPGDDLDVAQAQLGLDQDELADAQGDLARATGDQRAQIEQELTAREAAIKKAEAGGPQKLTAVAASQQFGTLLERARAWFAQRERVALLVQAEQRAKTDANALSQQHNTLEGANLRSGNEGTQKIGTDRVEMLKLLATRKVMMSILDDRQQSQEQLRSLYARWQAQVWTQHHIMSYLLIQSFAWLAFVILIAVVAATLSRIAIARMTSETRRKRTLETIVVLACEVFALLGIALVVFGAPKQMPTILGFVTAGITVVFQDFILGFFGWFTLMGRNGIRVGDWVEIDTVSGEVAEISLFHTVLLETGNWTTKGHPTGRRKSFSNSYALRGLFFNFSTNGQWMWDEIVLNVPATPNAYELIKQMHASIDEASERDTEEAEREWQHVAKDIGVGQFQTRPTVELRPAASGVDVIVRFVTRASERFATRNRVNAALLGVMEGTQRPALEAATGEDVTAPPAAKPA